MRVLLSRLLIAVAPLSCVGSSPRAFAPDAGGEETATDGGTTVQTQEDDASLGRNDAGSNQDAGKSDDGPQDDGGPSQIDVRADSGQIGRGRDGGRRLDANFESGAAKQACVTNGWQSDGACVSAKQCKDSHGNDLKPSGSCPSCGDNTCAPPESCSTCSIDCGLCDVDRVVVRVAANSDDAEESVISGAVNLVSPHLELADDGGPQIVAIRFTHVTVPARSTLTKAFIDFTVSEVDTAATDLTIRAEQNDDPASFAATKHNISTRPLTDSSATWSPTAWTTTGTKQRTPDLGTVVQEVISRPGWKSRNSLVFVVSGAGKRAAYAFEQSTRAAPALVLEYDVAPPVCGDQMCHVQETCATCPVDCGGTCPAATTLAVIGDYGDGSLAEGAVATLVNSWNPDHLLTLGDNNYGVGAAATIDDNVGQFYSNFIGSYQGAYGNGSPINRFWPTLGNHDWYSRGAAPYLSYFTLPSAPGGERYYEVALGSVGLFALDSDPNEPDGRTPDSTQAVWLKEALDASTACWKIVFMHHPPYSSSSIHGPTTALQWPFEEWGADSVFAGHDHHYERLQIIGSAGEPGIPYFVNGLGGRSRYGLGLPLPATQSRYNAEYGAMRVHATNGSITYEFYTTDETLIDTHTVRKACP